MEDTVDITEDVQAGIDAALARVTALTDADPDLVFGDVVETVALDCDVDVAVPLCAQSLGYVPDTVRRRVFEAEHEDTIRAGAAASAERAAAAEKARQRSSRAAATRAATLAAEAAAASAVIKSKTCPSCFQVRAPSGVCGCDD